MSFFGATFAAATLALQWHAGVIAMATPFIVFIAIGLFAAYLLRLPGAGVVPPPRVARIMMWSSIAEGVAILIAANLVVNLHRPEWLLPAIALIVGLHFLPIAHAAAFRSIYILGAVLIFAALIGFASPAPTGGEIAGLVSSAGLWAASILALRRDYVARRKQDVLF